MLRDPRARVFRRVRWTVGFATVLSVVAMLVYPGGTFLDHTTTGYSISRNFLSDLGATVAHDGRPNRVAAVCFLASLTLLVVALGTCLFALIRLFTTRDSRRFARVAAVVGLLVCAAFAGVALTPENLVLTLHVELTRFAFRTFPFVSVLLAAATWKEPRLPRSMLSAWILLAIVSFAYVAVLDWGPRPSSTYGLIVQVVAQKSIAVSAIGILLVQGFLAERFIAGHRPASDSEALAAADYAASRGGTS